MPAPTSLYFATAKQKLNLKLGQLGPVARGLQPTGVATAPAPPQPLLLPALEAGQEAQSPMPKLQVGVAPGGRWRRWRLRRGTCRPTKHPAP